MKKSLRTLIVDDSPTAIRNLCQNLAPYTDVQLIGSSTSAMSITEKILRERPNLLFLDVEMPDINGIDFLRELQPSMRDGIYVVFHSAHSQYLPDMLRVSAFDFLPKPYLPEELDNIIDRVREKYDAPNQLPQPSLLRLPADERKFAFQTLTGLLILRGSEILLFQFSPTNTWEVMLTDRSIYALRAHTTAGDLLSVSPSFLQVRQSCIINVYYLTFIENQSLRCILYPPFNDLDIIASRRFYAQIRNTLPIL